MWQSDSTEEVYAEQSTPRPDLWIIRPSRTRHSLTVLLGGGRLPILSTRPIKCCYPVGNVRFAADALHIAAARLLKSVSRNWVLVDCLQVLKFDGKEMRFA